MKKKILTEEQKKKKKKDQNTDMSNSSMERTDFIKMKFH